ncbi:MAG: hypothetical protein QOE32_5316, partial [Pseudonocardiales bacterium]|nr:hypothetical protein [Pseudonocardiales bacterium]
GASWLPRLASPRSANAAVQPAPRLPAAPHSQPRSAPLPIDLLINLCLNCGYTPTERL